MNIDINSWNVVGLAAAASALLGIWLGHVAVRKIEFAAVNLKLPIFYAAVLGLALELISLYMQARWLSTVFGILGITLLWDALELIRQERRVRKGHAPANPNNPRHQLILAAYPSATTVDLVKQAKDER